MRELSHPVKRHPLYLSAGELRALTRQFEGLDIVMDPLLREAIRRVRRKAAYLDDLPITQKAELFESVQVVDSGQPE